MGRCGWSAQGATFSNIFGGGKNPKKSFKRTNKKCGATRLSGTSVPLFEEEGFAALPCSEEGTLYDSIQAEPARKIQVELSRGPKRSINHASGRKRGDSRAEREGGVRVVRVIGKREGK